MTHVYIANAPNDLDFVKRLSDDLKKAGVPHWFDDGTATDQQVFAQLKNASHVLVVLSPHMMDNERVLGALEAAKQFKLGRIALRRAAMDNLPPQLGGILPLNAVDDDAYVTSLETLIHDLAVAPAEPEPELPEELLTALFSANTEIRRTAIKELGTYRKKDEAMRELALNELNAAIFRERDSGIKTLLRATAQSFEVNTGELPDVALPSKEELAEQARDNAVIIEPEEETLYFWRSSRWHVIWAIAGLIIAVIAFAAGGHWGYVVPVLVVAIILPELNIMIRSNGEFEWVMPGPLIGNLLIGIIFSGVVAMIVMLIADDLETDFLIVNVIIGALLGVAIGWLSSVEVDVDSL